MKPIIDELYRKIQNKERHNVSKNLSTLEHIEAALLNKDCDRILSNYRFENLHKSLPCIDPNLRSIYYLLRDILIFGSVFLIGFTMYLTSFGCDGFFRLIVFILGYGLTAGTVLVPFYLLAHECMHDMFLTNKIANHVVGFVLSTLLGIPYYSMCFSHAKHHKYVNHLFYGETFIPCNIRECVGDEKDPGNEKCMDIFLHIKNVILKIKHCIYRFNRGIFALINIFTTLLFGFDTYLLFNLGGGRIDMRTKREIKCHQPRDHYRSNSAIFLECQENLVRLSTLGVIGLWLFIFYLFNSYPVTTFCFYILPRIVANAWICMYGWIAHTDMNIPYHGPKTFNRFKSNISTIASNYGQILNHLHHHYGVNAVIHHLCPQIPHYVCRVLIPTIRDDVLSSAKLINLYNKFDDVYPTYRKLISCIKMCHRFIDELGIITDSQTNNHLCHIYANLNAMTDRDFFKKKCLNRTELSSVKTLRAAMMSIEKYEKRLSDTFQEFEMPINADNLTEMARICKQSNVSGDLCPEQEKKMDVFTVDMLAGHDVVSRCTEFTKITSETKNNKYTNALTLKKFVDMYKYKENNNPIFEKMVQNSIMCQFIEGPMDGNVYYRGFSSIH